MVFQPQTIEETHRWWLYQRSDLQRAAAVLLPAKQNGICSKARISSNIVVVPNGTNVKVSERSIRERTERTALCITRLHPVKGLDMLIEALATLRPHNWRLIIAGHRKKVCANDWSRKFAKLDLGGQIEIHPEVRRANKIGTLCAGRLIRLAFPERELWYVDRRVAGDWCASRNDHGHALGRCNDL